MKELLMPFILVVIANAMSFGQSGGQSILVKTKNKIEGGDECSVVVANGKLYLIGGGGPPEHVAVHNSFLKSWTKKPLPE
jgi:hypothetical protein